MYQDLLSICDAMKFGFNRAVVRDLFTTLFTVAQLRSSRQQSGSATVTPDEAVQDASLSLAKPQMYGQRKEVVACIDVSLGWDNPRR